MSDSARGIMTRRLLMLMINENMRYAVKETFLKEGWKMDKEASNNILTHIRDVSLRHASGEPDDAPKIIKKILDSNEVDLYEAFLMGFAAANAVLENIFTPEDD